MRTKGIFFCIILLFLATIGWAETDNKAAISPDSADVLYTGEFTYLIGPGDVLEIKVWRHPDLDIKATVRPDGKISFPTIGDISANNLTVSQFEGNISKGLTKLVNDPQTTVNVVGFFSKKIFILGEVNNPGLYPFEGQVSVVDAISRASGYKEKTAALQSVMVIRGGDKQKPRVLRLNIYDVIKKADFRQNIYLMPNDIVFVPKTFISNLDDFIEKFFSKTDPVLQYYLDVYNIRKPGILNR